MDQTPNNNEYDRFGHWDADDISGYVSIWTMRVEEIVD
jgi:hypothetical protein